MERKKLGTVKSTNGEKWAVTCKGNRKVWQKFYPDPMPITLEMYFDLKPQYSFQKKWIAHLKPQQQNVILKKIQKLVPKVLASNGIHFDMVILPQSNNEKVDWWTDYARAFFVRKYNNEKYEYDNHPFVYVEYRITHKSRLDEKQLYFYSNLHKMKPRSLLERYEEVMLNMFGDAISASDRTLQRIKIRL